MLRSGCSEERGAARHAAAQKNQPVIGIEEASPRRGDREQHVVPSGGGRFGEDPQHRMQVKGEEENPQRRAVDLSELEKDGYARI